MKVLKLLAFVLTLGMSVVSCSEDAETAPSVSGSKYESTYAKIVVDGAVTISKSLKSKAELVEAELYNVIEFKADGSFYIEEEKVATWSQSDANLSLIYEEDTRSATVSGDKITISFTETEGNNIITVVIEYSKI